MSDEGNNDFKTLVKTLTEVFKSHQSTLSDLLDGNLPSFSTKMHEESLITQPVKESKDFNAIMKHFVAGLNYPSGDIRSAESLCRKFLNVLIDLNGPLKRAAESLEKEMRTKVAEKLPDLSFLSQAKDARSSSTPGNVVSIKPKINRNAYSDDPPQHTSMEDYHKKAENVGQQDGQQQVTASNSPSETSPMDDCTKVDYQTEGEEEKDGRNIPGISSHFTFPNSDRPKPLTDPRNPIIPGKTQPGSASSPISPQQATNDSGLTMSKTQNPDTIKSEPMPGGESFKQPTQTACPSQESLPKQAKSDQSDLAHLHHQSQFTLNNPHVNDKNRLIIELLIQERKERQEDKRLLHQRFTSENERLTSENERLTSEISDLKKEIKRLRKECDKERDKRTESVNLQQKRVDESEDKLRKERCEFENEKRHSESDLKMRLVEVTKQEEKMELTEKETLHENGERQHQSPNSWQCNAM